MSQSSQGQGGSDPGVDRIETASSKEAQTPSSAAQQHGNTGRSEFSEQVLQEHGEIAADYLEALLDIADLEGDLEVVVERDRAEVAIVDPEDGEVPRALVGPNGEVLDALQELARMAVQASTGDRSRLMVDVGGYRAQRRADLERLADRAVALVHENGQRSELEPMTAFERKIVHDRVLAGGLQSTSEGVEPERRVVIEPAD